MHPTLFYIFGIQITTYGLMMAMGFTIIWLATTIRGKKMGYPDEFLQNLLTFVVICSFVFARLLHVMVDWDSYISHPVKIFSSRDGFVFLSGFVGAVLVSIWYARKHNQSVVGLMDLVFPFLALGQGIGRIGCFLFGCCYGRPCDLSVGIQFPVDSPAYVDQFNQGLIHSDAICSLPVYPTQLYESALSFMNFAILNFLFSRQKFKGQVGTAYVIIYSFERFFIEFFRGDYRGTLGLISTSQFISIFLFFIGIYAYLYLQKKKFEPVRVLEKKQSSIHL